MSELAFLSATALAAKIAAKEISSVELLNHYLDRVDRFNPDINAIVVDLREQALADAAQADAALAAGGECGPLHGVPMTVKESYNVTGSPTTWGNPAWSGNIANEDAESVKRLKEAGAVIFGKTNVPLSLADFQSYNEIYGTTNNPYDHTRVPGGSSGGSAAALAAGLTGIETGSDIGGSIRNPAHFCGVFGHKPSYSLLWMRGHAPPGDMRSSSDISVIGPLARSATDLEVALKAMAGPDDIAARGVQFTLPELGERKISDLKVGVWKNDAIAPVSKETQDRVELVAQALKDEGATVQEARPDFEPAHSHGIYQHLLHATMAMRMPDEAYAALKERAEKLDPADNSVGAQVLRGQVSSFKDWGLANEARHQLRWAWHNYFNQYDVMLTPMMATPAFEHDHGAFGKRTLQIDADERPYFEQVFWAGLTGVVFLPSTVIPTGLNSQGLPIGVQIVGPEYGDMITIGLAQRLEQMGFCFEAPAAYR